MSLTAKWRKAKSMNKVFEGVSEHKSQSGLITSFYKKAMQIL